MNYELIDTHAHIADNEFDADREGIIRRAFQAGVNYIVAVGSDIETSRKAVALAEGNTRIYAVVGIHPHEAKLFQIEKDKKVLEGLALFTKTKAIGEIGLDYHYKHSDIETQKNVFMTQLGWARKWDKPVIVHSREAERDTLDILKPIEPGSGILIHCFTGSKEFLSECVKRGYYVSFSGIVTFKKSDELRCRVKEVPPDRLMLETDSPYLAPEPYRGKRNEPAFLVHTAEKVSKILNISPEELSQRLMQNAKTFFMID